MASIPLPALDVKPQQSDPMESIGRVMALQNLMQQRQLQKEQIQGVGLENQSRQLDIQNRQAGMQAMRDWDGKDYNAIPDLMAKHGADLPTVMQARTGIVKYQQDLAAKSKTDLENLGTQNDHWAGLLANIEKLPPEQQPQAFEGAKREMIGQYLKDDPQAQQHFAQMQYQGPDSLDVLKKNALGMKGMLDAAQKEQQTKTAAQQEKTSHAEQIKTEAETGTGEIAYRATLARLAQHLPVSPGEIAAARAYEASQSKTSTNSDNLGIVSSNTSKPTGLAQFGLVGGPKTAAPAAPAQAGGKTTSAQQSMVDAIGQYKMDPNLIERALYRHPELLGLIHEKYPDWDQTAYQAKNKIVQSYTSGPESRSINAIGTALGHANELRDAITALGNGDEGLKVLRNLANKYDIQTGKDAITMFNLIVHRLAPEITAAYVQGGGGEGERLTAAEDFSPSLGNKQLVSNWAKTVELLQSKIAQQKQQWNTTFRPTQPQDEFETRFFSQPAKNALQRWQQEKGGGAGQPSEGPLTITLSSGKKITIQ